MIFKMLIQRLYSDWHYNSDSIKELIEVIKRHPGSCDEVWLTTLFGAPTLEAQRESAAKLIECSKMFREAGITVSLQFANTIGHGQYACKSDFSGYGADGSEVEHLVGPDGTAAEYCFCWNGDKFRKYNRELMRIYAPVMPHIAWIDDDLRATNHDPAECGCFCDDCINKFNKLNNSSFDRSSLVKEINFGDMIWREKFVDFVRNGMAEFTYLISKEIHDISPDTYMGFEYCAHGGFTGYGYDFIFDAMKRATGKNPKSRPGGGTYNDHNPYEIVSKMYFIMWQNYMLPEYVSDKTPEIENLPHTTYGKTAAGTCFETGLYLASGSNKMSYSMMIYKNEPMPFYENFFDMFKKHRPYWDSLVSNNEISRESGLRIYMPEKMYLKKLENEKPFYWNSEHIFCTLPIARTAIPLVYGRGKDDSPIFILHYEIANLLSDEDIEYLIGKPVITDGKSLELLSERGYSDYFSVYVEAFDAMRYTENILDKPINKAISGYVYYEWLPKAQSHKIINKSYIEPISEFLSTNEKVVSNEGNEYPYGIASAVIKTKAGAKWAVFGRQPWTNGISLQRRNQLLDIAEYIAGEKRLNAILESHQQAILLPRENDKKQTVSVSILNSTIGMSEHLKLRIRRPLTERFIFKTADFETDELFFEKDDDDYIVTTPKLMPWTIGTLFCY